MHWLTDPEIWASFLTLTVLEIVLGIDNLVFIAIVAGRLPADRANRVRQVGLAAALITRLLLLGSITWLIGLTGPLLEVLGHPVSWRDIVLIGGGLFLLYKATWEIHHQLERTGPPQAAGRASLAGVVAHIAVLDMAFSLDSVITAVGMAEHFWVMALAIIVAVAIMLQTAGLLSAFVDRHPTVKMLALSFLLLIGMTLIADGAGVHVPKAYIYVAIGFSAGVEALNQVAMHRRGRNVRADDRFSPGTAPSSRAAAQTREGVSN